MALRIQSRSWKNRDGSVTNTWRLIVEDYTGEGRKSRYPKPTEYGQYGLSPNDPIEVAKGKLKTLNASAKVKRWNEHKAKISERVKQDGIRESAYLPKGLYQGFITWLCKRRMWKEVPEKTQSNLACMRKLVRDLDLHPSEWPSEPEKIYQWFIDRSYSVSYVDKVAPLLDAYGYYYCLQFQKPYLKLPKPSGPILQRIEEAYYEKNHGQTKASEPIGLSKMDQLEDLGDEQVRWMRISVLFGPRPIEIDRLTLKHRGKYWDVRTDENGTPILSIFQTKLRRLEPARRWKNIPCLLPDQKKLIEEIEAGKPIKRPYSKTLQARLGYGHRLYGGRKNFEDLMKTLGQDDINVSRWLGHRSMKRTDDHYRKVGRVDYKLVPRKLMRVK